MRTLLVRLPDAELAHAIGPVPGTEYVIGAAARQRADEVAVYVADYATGVEALAEIGAFGQLKLVQLQSAGYDGFLERLPDGVALANATGVHDDATAEHALGLTLAALRGIGESVRQHGTWRRMPGRRSLADFLARLSDGALVVNVGRGPLLDTDAVLAEAGRLRFALDVTDPEPLPDGHPLWSAPEVLITPHVAGGTTAMLPRVAALVRGQLEAVVAGEQPRNLVSR